jgi:hypothetical protein
LAKGIGIQRKVKAILHRSVKKFFRIDVLPRSHLYAEAVKWQNILTHKHLCILLLKRFAAKKLLRLNGEAF